MNIRTIGSGAQHADINLWVAYVQANVVVAGLLTDDVTGAIVAAGCSVSAQQVVSGWAPGLSGFQTILTANAGDSFRDNANVRTNALFYNASNGAFFTSSYSTGNTTGAIDFQVDKFRIKYLQLKATGNYSPTISTSTVAITDFMIDSCIITATGANQGTIELHSTCDGASLFIQNSLIMSERSASSSSAIDFNGGCTSNAINLYDNTFWGTGSATDVITAGSYGKINVVGTVFPTFNTGSGYAMAVRDANTTGSNNATIVSAWATPFGSGFLTGLTASQFSIVTANEIISGGASPSDFRLKSGGTQLQTTGTTISGITTDISGFTRTPGSVDIGCWQFTAGGGTNVNLVAASASGVAVAFKITASKLFSGIAATAAVGSFGISASHGLTAATANGVAATFAKQISAPLAPASATGVAAAFASVIVGKTINLVAASATGGVSGFGIDVDDAFAAAIATGGAAPFGAQLNKTLAAAIATGAVGAFGPSVLIGLVPAAAIGAPGTFTVTGGANKNINLVAAAATGAVGSFGPSGSKILAGAAATATAAGFAPLLSPGVLVPASAVGAAGTFVKSASGLLVPAAAIGAAGVFGKELDIGLIGVGATGFATPFLFGKPVGLSPAVAFGFAENFTVSISGPSLPIQCALTPINDPLVWVYCVMGPDLVLVEVKLFEGCC